MANKNKTAAAQTDAPEKNSDATESKKEGMTHAQSKKDFEKRHDLGLKMRGNAKTGAIGNALAIFASQQGAKAANKIHDEFKLDTHGIMKVSGDS